MEMKLFCETATKIPVFQYDFGDKGPEILIIGGVHGDEPEGIVAARGVLQKAVQDFRFALKLCLIPEFNVEGILNKVRGNSRGVDLNRNLPTKDWSPKAATPRYHPGPEACSEPENQALVQLLKSRNFKFIVSLHSWNPMLNVNGNCQPEVDILHQLTGYAIEPDIGYPTPGSLGTYAGKELEIPTLTYEVQRELEFGEINRVHVPALWQMLAACEKR